MIYGRLGTFDSSSRNVQLEILPDHGYEASEVGVEQILGRSTLLQNWVELNVATSPSLSGCSRSFKPSLRTARGALDSSLATQDQDVQVNSIAINGLLNPFMAEPEEAGARALARALAISSL